MSGFCRFCCKTIFGVKASIFDSRADANTKHRFKTPFDRIRFLRARALSRRLEGCGSSGGPVANGMKRISYSGYRFPPAIIQQAIWLYLRFTLSLRDVEDLLAERGIAVSYESIRRWINHFGPAIAADLRKRRPCRHCVGSSRTMTSNDHHWHLAPRRRGSFRS